MNHLHSLTISCYPQVNNFNIPKILENVSSLRALRLKAFEAHPPHSPSSSSSGSSLDNVHVPQSMIPAAKNHDCDFRREMDGRLPGKLSMIEFTGKGIKKLGDNLFAVRRWCCVWIESI